MQRPGLETSTQPRRSLKSAEDKITVYGLAFHWMALLKPHAVWKLGTTMPFVALTEPEPQWWRATKKRGTTAQKRKGWQGDRGDEASRERSSQVDLFSRDATVSTGCRPLYPLKRSALVPMLL